MALKFFMPSLMLASGLFLAPAGAFADDKAHPANDMVVALTVVSESGKLLGYVLDAHVDSQGDIDLIRVAAFHTGETVKQTFDVEVSRILLVDDVQVVVNQPDIENVSVARNRSPEVGSRS